MLNMTRLPLILSCTLCLVSMGWAQSPSSSAELSKPRLVMVIAEDEYKTELTLPPFAQKNLAPDFDIQVVTASPQDASSIPEITAVNSADVVLLSMRRRPLPSEQLDAVRKYVAAGKPLVAIRTSSHAFCLRNQPPPEGLAEWRDFDPSVLGGNYVNHYGNEITAYVTAVPGAAKHPILKGVAAEELRVYGSLYRCQPLAKSARVLMTGRAEGIQTPEPVAWVNRPATGNRVFYTSLGHPQDFQLPDFVRLLRNGVYWAAGRDIPDREPVVLESPPDK